MSHLEHPELSRQEEKEIKDAFIAFNERKLHVVTCISNPVRFKSRYKLYHEFAHRMKNEPGVIFWTIELAFGNRPFEVTDANNPYHMQVRSSDELWHKENLINVLVNSKIPNDGFPIAVIDADVAFMNPNWVNETIEQLEHYDVVQMFKECIDFGPSYNLVSKECHVGVAYSFTKGIPPARWVECGYDNRQLESGGHCGYAWAWRRDAFETVGGLMDLSVVGAADWLMACSLMGETEITISGSTHPNFQKMIIEWGEKAKKLRKNIGYVDGVIGHYWHGPKSQRGYFWRNNILENYLVDPYNDFRYDDQGVLHLNDDGSDRFLDIKNALRNYFRSRNEDSIDERDEAYT